jgi:hypothetical protein
MLRRVLTRPGLIPVVLCIQVVPLLLFPPSAFTLKTQEWWLPSVLALLAVLSLVQILVRRNAAVWPWNMMSFAQGINIISRLMMIMPHATVTAGGVTRFDAAYVSLTTVALLLSGIEIWYCELPEVRGSIPARASKADPA